MEKLARDVVGISTKHTPERSKNVVQGGHLSSGYGCDAQ